MYSLGQNNGTMIICSKQPAPCMDNEAMTTQIKKKRKKKQTWQSSAPMKHTFCAKEVDASLFTLLSLFHKIGIILFFSLQKKQTKLSGDFIIVLSTLS